MDYVPDNYDMFLQREAEEAAWEEKRPTCSKCGEKIMDDYGYDIDGGLWCWNCTEEWLNDQKVDIDQMIEEEGGW